MLTIDVPRQLLDPLRSDCTNGEFIVLITGVESDYSDIESTIYSRNIGIAFTNETTIIEIFSPGNYCPANQPDYNSKYLSPKKQLELGIAPENVICNQGLELIFKSTDNSPACVKPKTAEKLFERGWVESFPMWAERTSIQCETWGKSNSIKSFYEEQGIAVYDTKTIEGTYTDARCEACGCLGWDTHYISVPYYDIDKILQNGWSRSDYPKE